MLVKDICYVAVKLYRAYVVCFKNATFFPLPYLVIFFILLSIGSKQEMLEPECFTLVVIMKAVQEISQ